MTARLRAPAKLTWSLRIVGVRDDGYHLIDAEMTTLQLADEVAIVDGGPSSVTLSGPFVDGVPTDESNLVMRALRLVRRPARVHVVKNVPSGAGLGGGSADAAAVLRWAGIDDHDVAARLGADVPFCLAGGRARVTGIGDIVEPLPPLPRVVTLVIPPLPSSTPAVYRAWDALGGPSGTGRNDLEPAAVAVDPRLAQWRNRIADTIGVRPVLAGSGATWFVEGDHERPLSVLRAGGATVLRCGTA